MAEPTNEWNKAGRRAWIWIAASALLLGLAVFLRAPISILSPIGFACLGFAYGNYRFRSGWTARGEHDAARLAFRDEEGQ